MVNIDTITYNIAVFIIAVFLLEIGADKFIDHTAIVAHRTGVSQTLVALLTAGAEWEELAVVIACLVRNRSSLAIGNIIGSAISNILGAFSLGLLFHSRDEPIHFDRSSRVYSLVLFAITTFATPVLYLPTESIWLIYGAVLVASFVFYVASIAWAITRGVLTAPEGSDSDSEDSSDTASSEEDEAYHHSATRTSEAEGASSDSTNSSVNIVSSGTPLLSSQRRKKNRGLQYHVNLLLLGVLSICLAGYVLAHAATTIVDELHMPDMLFGVVILAIATTLPEKFLAVMSGHRGHAGILVANTAGSNIFLLTLCLGIVVIGSKDGLPHGSVGVLEIGFLWGSTAAFAATVWCGARLGRWVGGGMILAYVAFVSLEFAGVHLRNAVDEHNM